MFDDDKTQVLTEGTADYPLDATLAANPEPCPNCQAEIAAASQFCGKCGYQRGTWGAPDTLANTDSQPEIEAAPALYYLVNDADRISIPAGDSVVGRGDVDLKLGDGYLSRQHAKFIATVETLEITDLGSANGTFVNDESLKANEPVVLTPGDSLKLGQTSFVIEVAEPADDDSADSDEPLTESAGVAETGEEVETPEGADQSEQAEESKSPWSLEYGEGEIIHFSIGETTLGRSASKSDVAIAGDGFISSLHLKVVAAIDNMEAEDLGSTNGTKLNGEKLAVNTPVELASGDTLEIGETKCRVLFVEGSVNADDAETAEAVGMDVQDNGSETEGGG